MLDGKLQSQPLPGFQVLQFIPIVVRYSAGVPSILLNPCNEDISLTDTGTGQLTVVLNSPALAPVIVQCLVRSTDPDTLGLNANLKGATTASGFEIVVNSDADGVTETDPVDLHILIMKQAKG
jgi:hypothetical protein